MLTLLTLLLAAPDGAVVWRFPRPDSDALRAAVTTARGEDPSHRVSDEEIEATLRQPVELGGCLDDARTCQDPALDALNLYGVRLRVDATATLEGAEHVVTLVAAPTAGGEPRTIKTRGPTLEAAVVAGLAELRGETTVRVEVKPDDATVLVDGKQVGQGTGHYAAAPGVRKIRVEAPGYTPLEQTVEVKVGETAILTFEMASADGQLALSIKPADATVKLDGKPVADWSQPLLLPPKEYAVEIAAEGHVTHTQKITVKQATRHDLKVTLPEARKSFLELLKTPHPDTLARNGYLRAGLRFSSVFDGPVDVTTTRNNTSIAVESLDDSVGLLGVNVSFGWRHQHWFIEGLGLSFDAGGDVDEITLSEDVEARIESLTRFSIKPAWVGVRYPAWRFDPYLQGGFVIIFEDFDLELPTETREVSNRLFQFGLEFGLRYAINPDWFVNLSGEFAFWPDERTSGAVLLGAGWAMDLPEWL